MPYAPRRKIRAKPKKYAHRKAYRKVKRYMRRKIPNMLSNKLNGPFPTKLYSRLKYNDLRTLTPAVGSTATYTYRLTSLYDPDYTGAGNQPRYYDTLCGPSNSTYPYNAYRVHAAKVTATFMSNTASTSAAYVAVRAYSDLVGGIGGAWLGPATLGELPWTKYKICQSFNAASSIRKIVMYVPLKKLLGVKDINDQDDLLANYNVNPTRNAYVDIYVAAADATTATAIICNVQIEYLCEFQQINAPAMS